MGETGMRMLNRGELDLGDRLVEQGVISLRGKAELRLVWSRQKAPLDYGALMFGIYVFLTFGSVVSALAIFRHTPIIIGLDTVVSGMVAGIMLSLFLFHDKLKVSFCDAPTEVLRYKNMLLLDKGFHEKFVNLLRMTVIFLLFYMFSGHVLLGLALGMMIAVAADSLEESRTIVLPCLLETMEKESYIKSAWARRGNSGTE